MSAEENELTRRLQIAPAPYFRIKDLLIREDVRTGGSSRDVLNSIAHDAPEVVIPIYEMLIDTGILLSSEGLERKALVVEETEKQEETETNE
jgi:hypothetical protein